MSKFIKRSTLLIAPSKFLSFKVLGILLSSLLFLLAFSGQPGLAQDQPLVNRLSIEDFAMSISLLVAALIIVLMNVTAELSWDAFKQYFLESIFREILVWFLFSLGIIVSSLLAEFIAQDPNADKSLSDLLEALILSKGMVIALTALLGSNVGELLLRVRSKSRISLELFIVLVGTGILASILVSQVYGHLDDIKTTSKLGRWSIDLLLFTCFHSVMVKAICAAPDNTANTTGGWWGYLRTSLSQSYAAANNGLQHVWSYFRGAIAQVYHSITARMRILTRRP
ncbi:MAG: hypothetical protein AAGA46_07370 [Cyanobacteria bacterium P01_F01_bin.13]